MLKQRKLFEQFPPVTTKEWNDRINTDLKGADFNRKLVWKTKEGFDVLPFYRKENMPGIKHAGYVMELRNFHQSDDNAGKMARPGNEWLVRQDIHVTDYETANVKAHSVLEKGADSLGFLIDDPISVSGKNFELLLKNLSAEKHEINFFSNGKAREILQFIKENCERQGTDLSEVRGCIETDPLGRLMINGTLCIPVDEGLNYLSALAQESLTLPRYRIVQVNGTNFCNSGADAVTELAFSISMGVEYLDQLTDRGLRAGQAASNIRFSFGTGSDYFMEIAKLRAARILWSLIRDGYDPDERESFRMEIHCSTSKWNATAYDPYVNMLRTQTEAMSAILGGTDSLTVNNYDIAFADPGEFSERIARNQQLILREEAYFDKVADPAAGSYYIENLTALVADHAWKLFLETEERGGFLEALKHGFIRDKIRRMANKRIRDVSMRREILLGTNLYPGDDEEILNDNGNSIRFSAPVEDKDLAVMPLMPSRASEEFEKLRIAVRRSGKGPKAFLFPVGDKTMRKARAQFSAGFFECGGYKVIDNDGFDSLSEGIGSALDSEAEIVVICSSDEEYMKYAPEIHRALNGRALTVIAGNPPGSDALKESGIENFISLRSDVVETLRYYNSVLGIS